MSRFLRKLRTGSRTERGQVLLLFAAGLAGFMGLAGMSIDVGQLVYTRTDLQKIADAAALAGAQDLPGSTADATASADSFAGKNGSATLAISFGTTNVANDTITVKATRHVDFAFLRVIGLRGADPSATAKAKANQKAITGYNWNNIAPFVIWGGNRKHQVNPGDAKCPYYVCTGKSYTFLDNQWMNASGTPGSDWSADSNNFKGDINHGAGNPVIQIGESFTTNSNGGLGSVTPPTPGTVIVVPVIDKATGNSNNRTFTIAAWAVVKVDSGCNKQGCKGTVQSLTQTPPDGWDTSGSVEPPPDLTYKGTVTQLTQ